MDDLTGKTLGDNYFLRKHIGQGATADVYLAWDKVRSSELAIKILHRDLALLSPFMSMFKREAEFIRELRHPNIVRFFDYGEDNNKTIGKIVFIVMEYIKGANLRELLLQRKVPFTIDETSQILAAICKALNYAHQNKVSGEKVLHCDIKPANILISYKDGNDINEKDVFLADFGISRWARQQKGGGTPAYMAPELFKGASVTEQADIYALGVTLYEMLSGGILPFRGETGSPGDTSRERIAWEKMNKDLPPLQQFNPKLPKSVAAVVEKAMNKNVGLRYPSVIQFWNEFQSALSYKGYKESPNALQIEHPPTSKKIKMTLGGQSIVDQSTQLHNYKDRPLRVFLCHSSMDKPAIRELYESLRTEIWIDPWLDEEKLFPGQDWETEIEKAVESSDVVIICLSNNSINKRGFVQKELRYALDVALEMPEETIFIIPLRLEDCTPPRSLRDWHYADYFEGQRERVLQKILVSLKRRAESLGLIK